MKAGDELLGTVFNKDHRYIVPIFQRPYVWDEEANWTPLWHDIRKAAEEVEREGADGPSDAPREYFLGAFVTQHQNPVPRRIATSQVIDGQQRLTTFQVFLAAAHRIALELGSDSAAGRFGALVGNRVSADSEHPEDAFKVTPLRTDEPAFRWAMRNSTAPVPAPDPKHRLAKASVWFEKTLKEWLGETDNMTERLDLLHFAVANRIKVVSVYLDGRDDPQVIFEALNHKGVRLDAADLVKNLLFQSLDQQGDHALQYELYEKHWKRLDGGLWREEVVTGRIPRVRVDALLAYWLSVQRGEESSVEHLFEDFKRWLKSSGARAADVIRDIRRSADTMDRLQSMPLTVPVAQVIDRLDANRTTTPWPLLLFLYANEAIPDAEAEHAALALDSFLMRRAICRLETKDYNRLFASILATLKAADPLDAGRVLEGALAAQSAPTRVWPSDGEFIGALIGDDLYNTLYRARLKSLLVGIENQMLSDKAEPDAPRSAKLTTLSIEHVLPQGWEKTWPLPDSATEQDVAARWAHIHRVGNLTLTTKNLNSSLSNNPWKKKRHSLQTHSLVRLTTASILTYPAGVPRYSQDEWASVWDETRIDLRSMWLIKHALNAWPRPADIDEQRVQVAAHG